MKLDDLKTLRKVLNYLPTNNESYVADRLVSTIESAIELGFDTAHFYGKGDCKPALENYLSVCGINPKEAVTGDEDLTLWLFKEEYGAKIIARAINLCKAHADILPAEYISVLDLPPSIDFKTESNWFKEMTAHNERLEKQFGDCWHNEKNKPLRRKKFLQWIGETFYKGVLKKNPKDDNARQIVLAAFPLAGYTKLQTLQTVNWIKPLMLEKFFQSLNIDFHVADCTDVTFSENEIDSAETFIVDTIKTKYPKLIPLNNDAVSSYFDTPINTPFGLVYKKFGYVDDDTMLDTESDEYKQIALEESQATFVIDSETYHKHKKLIDTFADSDTTIIYDKNITLKEMTADKFLAMPTKKFTREDFLNRLMAIANLIKGDEYFDRT